MFPYNASEVCDPCTVCENLPVVLKLGDAWQAGCPHCGVCADLAQDRLAALVKWNLLHRSGDTMMRPLTIKQPKKNGWAKLKEQVRKSK
jgi:hypothetical protein